MICDWNKNNLLLEIKYIDRLFSEIKSEQMKE